jgi:type III pantothenate kinase
MNLVIDVGNTLVKLGVFETGALKHKKSCIKTDFLDALSEISESFPKITNSIVSSVANLSEHQLSKLQQLCNVSILNHETKIPFTNCYATPQTLGIDRIALVSAAADKYKGGNVLVIDAGTCITYDFLNSKNEYKGGSISPGISIRYKSLHTFTDKLPLLEATNLEVLTGNSTTASIHTGIVNGVSYEIDGFVNAYRNNFKNLTVILTGGDAHFLRDTIKNDIFANSNFLLEGLNHILEYNKH